jgi:hypothetical protein
MDKVTAAFSALPSWALVAIAILVCVQIALQVYALIDLSRRDSVLWGRKWVWAVIIIAGNLLGAVIYLGLGRVVDQPDLDAPERGGTEQARRRAMDDLYGDRK